MKTRRCLFPAAAALLAAFAALLPAASRAAAPVARIVSVEERKPAARLGRFRGAGLSAFDEEPSMGDATFSVKWYAAPPGAPEGTLLYAECLFARSQTPRTFFAPQRDATEGYRTSEITVPGAVVARCGAITCWQVTLSYRGTVIDRWVSEAGWTPVGELPEVGMDVPPVAADAPGSAPPPAAAHARQRMTVQAGQAPIRQAPVAGPRNVPQKTLSATRASGTGTPRVRQPLATQPTRPAAVAAPAQPAAAPRRPIDPNAPVGWSPASGPVPAPRPVSSSPLPSAQPARRPVGIQPSRPDNPAATRSLP